MMLCDWNSTRFCITPYHFNQSQFEWEQIQVLLDGRLGNNSLDIIQLENKVEETLKQEMSHTDLDNVIQSLPDKNSGLDPKAWI